MKALKTMDAQMLVDIFVCPVCGHTMVGEPPEKCSVCGAVKKLFKKID